MIKSRSYPNLSHPSACCFIYPRMHLSLTTIKNSFMITELKLDMESAFNAINCRLRLNILYRVELNGTGQIMIKKMFFFFLPMLYLNYKLEQFASLAWKCWSVMLLRKNGTLKVNRSVPESEERCLHFSLSWFRNLSTKLHLQLETLSPVPIRWLVGWLAVCSKFGSISRIEIRKSQCQQMSPGGVSYGPLRFGILQRVPYI